MPYKGVDEDQKKISDFAFGEEGGRLTKATVHTLKPKPEYSVRDDIIQALEVILADIRSGEIEVSHLIIGWGEKIDIDGQAGTAYIWDAVGLEMHEVIGHLTTYAAKLAMGEGE